MTVLRTHRLSLQPFQAHHRDPFARLHADPHVMADLGGPIERWESDEKFDRYCAVYQEAGVSRWALEDLQGRFLGYAGVIMRPDPRHPLGKHHEVGWRLATNAWGCGYAAEGAAAALDHAFETLKIEEIFSYTSQDNLRSQAVMRRLGLRREPSRDFVALYPGVGSWSGLVWIASPPWR